MNVCRKSIENSCSDISAWKSSGLTYQQTDITLSHAALVAKITEPLTHKDLETGGTWSSFLIFLGLMSSPVRSVCYLRLHWKVITVEYSNTCYWTHTLLPNLVVHSQLFNDVWLQCKCYGVLKGVCCVGLCWVLLGSIELCTQQLHVQIILHIDKSGKWKMIKHVFKSFFWITYSLFVITTILLGHTGFIVDEK